MISFNSSTKLSNQVITSLKTVNYTLSGREALIIPLGQLNQLELLVQILTHNGSL